MSRRRYGMNGLGKCLSAAALVVILLGCVLGAQLLEKQMTPVIENAGQQLTSHLLEETTAQVFMNDRWYQRKNVETLLVMGIDNFGAITSSDSYNNTNQADFLVLFLLDKDIGETAAIHLNRDTITEITMLGVTGEAVGTQRAQLALAFNYGRGGADSSQNTMDAVSRLLYGVNIDHYITVTMDAVPIMNDWAQGVNLEVLHDMTSVNPAWTQGTALHLAGQQALDYVRTRRGLDDSTNLNRMERQRQYASAWVKTAQTKLQDAEAVGQLVFEMSDYHSSDCTVSQLAEFANGLGNNPSVEIHEIPGEAIQGDTFMEFYADDAAIQQLVLKLFYAPVGS